MADTDTQNAINGLDKVDTAIRSAEMSQQSSETPKVPDVKQLVGSQPSAVGEGDTVTDKQPEDVRKIPTHDDVKKTINSSPDMITAVEAVGAMYGIPSTCMMCSNKAKSIRVEGDTICVPEKGKPSMNTKAIVSSIGALLDTISQRVDDKLNQIQNENIEKDRLPEEIASRANPNKGTVVLVCKDDNGDDIIAYDTGLVDCADTEVAREKVRSLRQNLQIPMYSKQCMSNPKYAYFNDNDNNIMEGVDTDTTDENVEEYTINIQDEDPKIVSMCESYGFNRALGYSIMQEAGFDFVKPFGDVFYQESSKSKKKDISKDIEHMKFDNKNITKAIECFNEARNEQKETELGEIDLGKLIASKKYAEGIKALEEQFDAHINIRFIDSEENNIFTIPDYSDAFNASGSYKQKVSLSKKKGFQLGGLPVDIFIIKHSVEKLTVDPYFGQSFTSILLHEIFHNIYRVIQYKQLNEDAMISIAMGVATASVDAKSMRKVFTKLIDSMDEFYGAKINILNKRLLVKKLCEIASVNSSYTTKQIDDVVDTVKSESERANTQARNMTNAMNKRAKEYKNARKYTIFKPLLVGAADVAAMFFGMISGPIALMIAGCTATYSLCTNAETLMLRMVDKSFKSYEDREEHFCDMFSAMYQVPVRWFNLPFSKYKYTPNELDSDVLKAAADAEKVLRDYTYTTYPTNWQRSQAGVKVAKKMLESKTQLSEPVKEYLQWIVDNYSSLLEDSTGLNKSDHVFDAESAEDLDKHIGKLLKDSSINVTESYSEEDTFIFDENDVYRPRNH